LISTNAGDRILPSFEEGHQDEPKIVFDLILSSNLKAIVAYDT